MTQRAHEQQAKVATSPVRSTQLRNPLAPTSTRSIAVPSVGQHELALIATRRSRQSGTGVDVVSAGDPLRRGVGDAPAELEAGRSGGVPLATLDRARLEAQLGTDLSAVRLHRGARTDELAAALGATAFTSGTDVFLGVRSGAPDTQTAHRVLAHELVHVVQQAAGPVNGRAGPGGLRVSDPNDHHEHVAVHDAERLVSGAAVDLGCGVAVLQRAPSAIVQRQTPSPVPSFDADRRQDAMEANLAALNQDTKWSKNISALFLNWGAAIDRITGSLLVANGGFKEAEVHQDEFNALVMQVLLAVGSVSITWAFEPLLAPVLGKLGKTADETMKIVEQWENPVAQGIGSTSDIVPATQAIISRPESSATTGVAPSGDPLAYLARNGEELKRRAASIEQAFGDRAAERYSASYDRLLALDLRAHERAYSAEFAKLAAASAGVDDLKAAEQLDKILERHLWAQWLKRHGIVAVGEEVYTRERAPTPEEDLDPEEARQFPASYTISGGGIFISHRLNAVGVAGLAGVNLSSHWYWVYRPYETQVQLLKWAWSYRESMERTDLGPAIPVPTE